MRLIYYLLLYNGHLIGQVWIKSSPLSCLQLSVGRGMTEEIVEKKIKEEGERVENKST